MYWLGAQGFADAGCSERRLRECRFFGLYQFAGSRAKSRLLTTPPAFLDESDKNVAADDGCGLGEKQAVMAGGLDHRNRLRMLAASRRDTGWEGSRLRRLAFIAIVLCGCHGALAADVVPPDLAVVPPVSPAETGRITFMEENDAILPTHQTDRWYTQGFELNYLSQPVAGTVVDRFLPGALFDPAIAHTRRFELVVGQTIFTPENLRLSPPDPTDRPYGGFLYGGAGIYQENDHRSLDHAQLLVGVVGPASLAEEVQNGFHALVGQIVAPWQFQLKNEPAVVLSYEHLARFDMPLWGGISVDFIPQIGGAVGNVYDYGQAGTLVRLGRNLKADYGPDRIKPAMSGTSWFDPSQLDGPFGWYFFAGVQGRVVGRDIFLDGNTFASSPSVQKRLLVGDLSAGFSVFWSDIFKVDYVIIWRSQEFDGQRGDDRFAAVTMSWRLP